MAFDRMEVFSDIGIFLGCLIAGLIVLSFVTMLMVRNFRMNHPMLGWLAAFLNTGKTERYLFVCLLSRLFAAITLLFGTEFVVVPLLIYLFMCLVIYVLSRQLKFVAFDFFCSAELVTGYYFYVFLKSEAGRAQAQYGIGLLILLAALFLFGFSVIQFVYGLLNLRASRKTMEGYQRETAEEKALERRVWLALLLPLIFSALPAVMFLQVPYVEAGTTVYQFVQGQEVRYEGGGKLRKGDNTCLLLQEEESVVLDASVLYFDGEEKLFFPSVCSVIRPSLQLSNRILPMSVLEKNEDGYQVLYEKQSTEIEDFFLFDGKDTYYFPAGTILRWQGESYETKSLCLVTAKYNQYIVIYDLAEREYQEIPVEEGYCTALLPDKTNVNLSTDIIYRENGQEQMLFMQPSLLTDLE